MILTYDAVDDQGRRSTDTLEAGTISDAVGQLRGRGLYVTRITEKASDKKAAAAEVHAPGAVRMPLKTLALFTRQLAMLLRAGSALVPALTALKRQMIKPGQAALLDGVIHDLEEGSTLTDAFRRYPRTFDAVYCAITAAGEASGALTAMFERLSIQLQKRRAMRGTILGSLAYPALLLVMCTGIFNSLLFFVLPRFHDMFEQLQVETPTLTRYLLVLGDTMRTYWPVGLGAVILFGGGAAMFLRTDRGQQWTSDVQTAIPIVGKLRSKLIQAQVLRTLGMLVESHTGILEALGLVRKSTRNRRFQAMFDGMEEAVTSGGTLATALEESKLVEPQICQVVRTGEESGRLGEAMTYCAEVLDETNAELLALVTKLIEPIILIGLGLIVGTVAIALFLPLFDLTSAMG